MTTWIDEERLKTDDAYCYDLFRESFIDRSKENVELLIATGANVNVKDKAGWTPLHCAVSIFCACHHHLEDCHERPLNKEIIELLIKNGANVNAKNNDEVTPLKLAMGKIDDQGISEMLIEAGANIDDVDNWTLFPWAIAHGKKEIIGSRLDKGMSVNIEDAHATRWTPLHYAVSFGQKDIVELLIDKKANVNVKSNFGAKPLHLIGKGDYHNIGELLINYGAEVDSKDYNNETPLFYVVNYKLDKGVIEFLIDKGADVNIKSTNDANYTVLHVAAKKNNMDAIKLLIKNGAEIDSKDDDNRTPLYYAIDHRSDNDLIEFLINEGADIYAKDRNGSTLLHVAALRNNKNIVELLIDKGLDPNAENNFGRTPLDNTQFDVAKGKDVKEILRRAMAKATTKDIVPTTIESFMREVTSSNRNNGIIDMRNSTISSLTTTVTVAPNSNQSIKEIMGSPSNLVISNNTENIRHNTSDINSFNDNASALIVLVGCMFAYLSKKLFSSPLSSIDEPLVDQYAKGKHVS